MNSDAGQRWFRSQGCDSGYRGTQREDGEVCQNVMVVTHYLFLLTGGRRREACFLTVRGQPSVYFGT